MLGRRVLLRPKGVQMPDYMLAPWRRQLRQASAAHLYADGASLPLRQACHPGCQVSKCKAACTTLRSKSQARADSGSLDLLMN